MTKKITKAMIREAQQHGLTVTEAADYFGVSRSTFDSAVQRNGMQLRKDKPGPQKYSGSKEYAASLEADVTIPSWSCKPSAIAKALKLASDAKAAKVRARA